MRSTARTPLGPSSEPAAPPAGGPGRAGAGRGGAPPKSRERSGRQRPASSLSLPPQPPARTRRSHPPSREAGPPPAEIGRSLGEPRPRPASCAGPAGGCRYGRGTSPPGCGWSGRARGAGEGGRGREGEGEGEGPWPGTGWGQGDTRAAVPELARAVDTGGADHVPVARVHLHPAHLPAPPPPPPARAAAAYPARRVPGPPTRAWWRCCRDAGGATRGRARLGGWGERRADAIGRARASDTCNCWSRRGRGGPSRLLALHTQTHRQAHA